MKDNIESTDSAKSTTTDHIVIECPQCRTRFSLNAMVLDGIQTPQFQCSDCEKVFAVNTDTLQRVSVISNSNPPQYPKSFPQADKQESSTRAVNDWAMGLESHDATFDEFMEVSRSPEERSELIPGSSNHYSQGLTFEASTANSETPLVGSHLQTTSQIYNNSSWTLGDSKPSLSEDKESHQGASFLFEDPTVDHVGSTDASTKEMDLLEDEIKESAFILEPEESSNEETVSSTIEEKADSNLERPLMKGDFSEFFIEKDLSVEDGPIQQELPFSLTSNETSLQRQAHSEGTYRERDTLPFREQQVFVAPGEMGGRYPRSKRKTSWKGMLWLIAPLVALVLIFWGYSRYLSDSNLLIDSFISGSPEVAPAGLMIDDIRLEKLRLHGEEDVILLSGRLKNKTLKTFEEIILESRILVNSVAQEVQRATAFSPLPHTDIKELSSDLLKELQSKRAARVQKLEPGQELHFQMILTPGVIEETPVHSTRIYSVKTY